MTNLVMFAVADPICFEEAVKCGRWRNAMHLEIQSIEKNETQELTNLPAGGNKIGVKWMYKTKLNENKEVDKYKAHLVAKMYTQQHIMVYNEVFVPITRSDTIWLVFTPAAKKRWIIYQLDVKPVFLHCELSEEVFVG